MTSQAQTLADRAVKDFAGAIKVAYGSGFVQSTGFGCMEYTFEDGSVLSLRGGRVVSPQAKQTVYRDACCDINVR